MSKIKQLLDCIEAVPAVKASFQGLDEEARAELDELMRRLEPETTTAKDKYHRPQTSTTGVNAYFGKLPGDETEEELLEAVNDTPQPTGDVGALIDSALARIDKVNDDKENPLPVRAMACSFDATFRKLHKAVAAMQAEHETSIVDGADRETQLLTMNNEMQAELSLSRKMLADKCDQHMEAETKVLELEAERDRLRGLVGELVPHIKFHKRAVDREDDCFFTNARCPVCDTGYPLIDNEPATIRCTNPDCPAVRAREYVEGN